MARTQTSLKGAPYGCVMCGGIWRVEVGRDGPEHVASAGCGAEAEEEPRALQVRQLRQLAEQRVFGFESFGADSADVLWRAYMGVPSATKPCCCGGRLARQGPKSAIPGGVGPPA